MKVGGRVGRNIYKAEKVAYVRYYLPSGSKVASYVQVLTRGNPKSRIRMVVSLRTHVCVLFVEYDVLLVGYVR